MTPTRQPAARGFYPGDCQAQIEQFIRGYHPPDLLPEKLIGGVVPHAGWSYSGATAAQTLYTLSLHSQPKTCIIFGTDHTGVMKHALYPEGEWEAPLGSVPVDSGLAGRISREADDLVLVSAEAHSREHSIEVIVPMILTFWPEASIVPITVRPEESAKDLGQRVAEIAGNESVVYIASTDLTHYCWTYGFSPAGVGAEGLEWLQRNDRRIIDLLLSVSSAEILEEAQNHHNACGAGAVTAVTAAVSYLGVKSGNLIAYTTSHGDAPADEFTTGVGYVGLVW